MYNECRHIFTGGKKCQSPALKEQNFCYFHQSNRKRRAPKAQAYEPYIPPQDATHNLTPLEDDDAIQLALSDVVLALAANRIDPRRAQILIYGLQVASQNHRHRAAMAAKEPAAAQTIVRETHEHEDGTLIGPPKQTPDPEEIPEKRRPSLGEILLREVEEMKAQRIAEEEAQQKAESAEQPVTIELPQIHAVADTPAPANPQFQEAPGLVGELVRHPERARSEAERFANPGLAAQKFAPQKTERDADHRQVEARREAEGLAKPGLATQRFGPRKTERGAKHLQIEAAGFSPLNKPPSRDGVPCCSRRGSRVAPSSQLRVAG
jgi:hypothetical protein